MGCINTSYYLWSNFHFTFFTQSSMWLAPENKSCVHRIILSRNLRIHWVNLLFKISLTQYFPSCIICSVYRLSKSSWSVSIKRKGETSCSPKKETFYILILSDQKAKFHISHFAYLIWNDMRWMLSEYIWTGGIMRGFSNTDMATKTRTRKHWRTMDYSNIK